MLWQPCRGQGVWQKYWDESDEESLGRGRLIVQMVGYIAPQAIMRRMFAVCHMSQN
jgi:hypothetical protein